MVIFYEEVSSSEKGCFSKQLILSHLSTYFFFAVSLFHYKKTYIFINNMK